MFTRKDILIQKTGKNGVNRQQFLTLLVQEFHNSPEIENKKQVLTNLSNFAYDPINYEFIKELHVLELFMQQLTSSNTHFIRPSLAGLCNLSSDPAFVELIVRNNGIPLVSQYLLHSDEEISLNALTTLIFLITTDTLPLITSPEIICKVLHYQSRNDARFRNLSTIFLDDFCTSNQIEQAKGFNLTVPDIPMPGDVHEST